MPDESSTPDLMELNRAFIEAANRGDVDAFMNFFAPDAVWDNSSVGTGTFKGAAAVRGVVEDWIGVYEQFEVETEEFRDLGNGVGFGVNLQTGRPAGSTGVVQLRQGFVSLVEGGLIQRVATYLDPDEARAAAERLAQERGQAVSKANVELARKALEQFIATGEPAWHVTHRDVEVYDHDIMDGEDYRGRAGVVRWLEDWSSAWAEFSMEPEEFIDAGERVVAVVRMRAKGRSSGLVLDRQDAVVQELRDGMIVRIDYYNNRDQALKAVGLKP